MACAVGLWDVSHMAGADPTPFQAFVARALEALPESRNFYDRQIQQRLNTTGKPLFDIARRANVPKRETLRIIAEVLGQPLEKLERAIDGEDVTIDVTDAPPRRKPADVASEADDEEPVMVEIQHIDLTFGLGATFTDRHVEIELLKFPRQWVETITISSPALLTWARGSGDSMIPTINDGDLVLLDRSQRDVREQDALWAITIGDTGSIKRLRKKGDRFQIFSDNPAVPPDEEPIDFVNVVARVVFVGRRT